MSTLKSKKTPTEQMLVDLLNGNDISVEILSLYHNYIVAASTMSANNIITGVLESYIDEDLMQVIKMNVVMSLPNLRKKLISHLDENDEFKINIK